MAKEVELLIRGTAKFRAPADKAANFDAALQDGTLRISLDLELPKSDHTIGFELSDVVTGSFHVKKIAGQSYLYSVEVDAVMKTFSLGPKDVAEIKSGKAKFKFSDIGYKSEWYPEVEFQDGATLTITANK